MMTSDHLWLNIGTAILIIRLGLIGVQGKAVLILYKVQVFFMASVGPYTEPGLCLIGNSWKTHGGNE